MWGCCLFIQSEKTSVIFYLYALKMSVKRTFPAAAGKIAKANTLYSD